MTHKSSFYRKMNAVLLFAMMLTFVSCGRQGIMPLNRGLENTPENPAETEVQFLDSASFDTRLSSALSRSAPSVTVEFPAAVSINDIPERLDKWLFMVEENSGKVSLEAAEEEEAYAQRGLITEIITLAVGGYSLMKEAACYKPATDYNVAVYYEKAYGTIKKVVFTRKQ
jgi:hypothetical protein